MRSGCPRSITAWQGRGLFHERALPSPVPGCLHPRHWVARMMRPLSGSPGKGLFQVWVGAGREGVLSVWRPCGGDGQGFLSPPTYACCGRNRGDPRHQTPTASLEVEESKQGQSKARHSFRGRDREVCTRVKMRTACPERGCSGYHGSWQQRSSVPSLDPGLTPNQGHLEMFT